MVANETSIEFKLRFMKKIFIILIALVPSLVFAQKYEATVGAGIGMTGTPGDNLYYKGDKAVLSYALMANVMQNFGKYNWQAGVQFNALPMSGKTSKEYISFYNSSLVPSGKKVIYSNLTSSLCFVANKKFDLSDLKFLGKMKPKGDVYVGITLGFAFAKNATKKDSTDKDVIYQAPDGGVGPVYGLQLGYTYPLNNKWSANIELGLRYYYMYFTAQAPHVTGEAVNLHFGVMTYPITVGVKYNFFGLTKAQRMMNEAKKTMSSEGGADSDVEGQ
jgi:hypothetical protein